MGGPHATCTQVTGDLRICRYDTDASHCKCVGVSRESSKMTPPAPASAQLRHCPPFLRQTHTHLHAHALDSHDVPYSHTGSDAGAPVAAGQLVGHAACQCCLHRSLGVWCCLQFSQQLLLQLQDALDLLLTPDVVHKQLQQVTPGKRGGGGR